MFGFRRMKHLTSVWSAEEKYRLEVKLKENQIYYRVKIRDPYTRGFQKRNSLTSYGGGMTERSIEYVFYVDQTDFSRAMNINTVF